MREARALPFRDQEKFDKFIAGNARSFFLTS
jgi:hypothetical protein